jgi:hypothetical protein
MSLHLILGQVRQTKPGQNGVSSQGDVVEHQLPIDSHPQLAPAFLELPGVQFARLSRLATDDAYQRVTRAGRMPRSLSALVIASSVVALVLRIASMTGKRPLANWSAAQIWICRPHTLPRRCSSGCPARRYLPFFAARAAFVRSKIRRRSFRPARRRCC